MLIIITIDSIKLKLLVAGSLGGLNRSSGGGGAIEQIS